MGQDNVDEWLGPQSSSGGDFARRMRLHQSWWRAVVLNVPYGTGPRRHSTAKYGNMLQADAAERGRNFLTDHIWQVVQERIALGGGVEPYRCKYNLLSSQPMCFNLFGQLRGRNDLATTLFRALLPEEIGQVEEVIIEWAPSPTSEYLDDQTSFDAFVRYRRASDGTPAFIAIETKLTEPFSDASYAYAGRYRYVTEQPGSPWRQETRLQLADTTWNQLWRNHMLAVAFEQHPDSDYTFGIPIVVQHPGDASGHAAVAGYRELLVEPESIHAFDLQQVVDAWRPLLTAPDDREWIDNFDRRYLQLSLSSQDVTE